MTHAGLLDELLARVAPCSALLRQLRGSIIPEPCQDKAHRDAWHYGGAATSTRPASAGTPAPTSHHDNDLQLP